MNIYDKDDGFTTFTLTQANAILPQVILRTQETLELLETARRDYEDKKTGNGTAAREEFNQRTSKILEQWSVDIVELGAYPKGYFTVDFKSPVPETLFCWTLGEERVTHTHKTYETFKDRIKIKNEVILGFENSLN